MANSPLHVIIARAKGAQSKATAEFNQTHHLLQRTGVTDGLSRIYQPNEEGGLQLPPEHTLVKVKVNEELGKVAKLLTESYDTAATREYGNCQAKADIKVDGTTVLSGVPVGFLLFLEKQLKMEILPFLAKLPVLDPALVWTWDADNEIYRTEPTWVHRNEKRLRNHVMSRATEKHPEQVQVVQEDVPVGKWHSTKYSGAIPAARKAALIHRAEQLLEAVRVAREEANAVRVEEVHVGADIFNYLLAGS